MPQPLIKARTTIFLASERKLRLAVQQETDSSERADTIERADFLRDSHSGSSPESYIRELKPRLLDDEAEKWLAHIKAHSSCGLFESIDERVIQELPALHPILDIRTPLEVLAVSAPPQLTLLQWLWMALLCA